MVIHWRKTKEPGWKTSAFINGFGAVVTGIVLVIVAVTKTLEGAWIVLLLIPLIVAVFKATRQHYDHVASQLTLRGYAPATRAHNTVVMPIGGMQRAVVEALRYAETLSDDVRAVYVDIDPRATEQIKNDWDSGAARVTLVVLPSPYRSVMEPLLEYIEQVETERPDDYVTVILPEFVPARWWQHLLHNQRALLIKGALLFRPNTVVTSVPFHLETITQAQSLKRSASTLTVTTCFELCTLNFQATSPPDLRRRSDRRSTAPARSAAADTPTTDRGGDTRGSCTMLRSSALFGIVITSCRPASCIDHILPRPASPIGADVALCLRQRRVVRGQDVRRSTSGPGRLAARQLRRVLNGPVGDETRRRRRRASRACRATWTCRAASTRACRSARARARAGWSRLPVRVPEELRQLQTWRNLLGQSSPWYVIVKPALRKFYVRYRLALTCRRGCAVGFRRAVLAARHAHLLGS